MIKVSPIIPKSLRMFAPAAHKRAIERSMAMGVAGAQEEIKTLTSKWSTPPAVHVSQQGDATLIAIADDRWTWADLGTKPHTITPKRAKVLHFVTKAGSEVFTKRVNHPGTKPQYLTKKVQARVNALNLAGTFANLVGELTR
jgi:hypothetical protein